MKLYLSSYGLGNNPQRLQALVGGNKRAAVIANAQDASDPSRRAARVNQHIMELRALGFAAEELDLRNYFDTPNNLAADLATYGLVWVRGGNVFVLRRAMKQSAFDECIKKLVESESLVYGGFSAGICVVTPTLQGIELVDDPKTVPLGYQSDVIWEGLNFVPYSIAPHYRSIHPESEDIEKTIQFFKEKGMSYRTLSDGQALVVNGLIEETIS